MVMEKIFEKLDTNHDGFIDLMETEEGLKRAILESRTRMLQMKMEKTDTSLFGRLEKYYESLGATTEGKKKIIDDFKNAAGKDGKATWQETKAALIAGLKEKTTEEEIQMVMEKIFELDTNHDGFIDLMETEEGLKRAILESRTRMLQMKMEKTYTSLFGRLEKYYESLGATTEGKKKIIDDFKNFAGKDGKATWQETKAALIAGLKEKTTEEEIQMVMEKTFEKFDTNHDGFADLMEVEEGLEREIQAGKHGTGK